MTFDEALEYYEMHLYNRNLADSTIMEYKKELKRLNSFLIENNIEDLDEIRTLHLEKYLAHNKRKGNRAATISNKKSAIVNFFKYCKSQEIIDRNPADALRSVKITDEDRKKKETLTIKETYKFIEKIEKNSRNKLKNKLIIKMFSFCGLRVSELAKLKWEDIDWKEKFITIRGKGRKQRLVPLFPDIEKDLKEHKQSSNSEYIFTAKNTSKPMSTRNIYNIVNTHAKKANIRKKVGCHTLRRTSATNYLREGVNVRYIQKFLGHSNLSTTSGYLDPDQEDVARSLLQAHKSLKKRMG